MEDGTPDPGSVKPGDVLIGSKRREDRKPMATFNPQSLIGRTYLKFPEEDDTRYQAKIVEAIKENEKDIAKDPAMQKFHCSVNQG